MSIRWKMKATYSMENIRWKKTQNTDSQKLSDIGLKLEVKKEEACI